MARDRVRGRGRPGLARLRRSARRGTPTCVVALDGRERRSRGHRARPPLAPRRRRTRRAGLRRRNGRTAGGPRCGSARVRGLGRGRGHGGAHRVGAPHGTRRRDLVGVERRRRAVGRARRRDEEGGLVGARRQRGRAGRGRAGAAARGAGPLPGLPAMGCLARRRRLGHGLARAGVPRRPVARGADARPRPRFGVDRRVVVPDRRFVRPHARTAAGPRRLVDGLDRAGVRRSRHGALGRGRVAGTARLRRRAAGIRGAAGERRRRRVPGCRGAAA